MRFFGKVSGYTPDHDSILGSRRQLIGQSAPLSPKTCEGGCGVIGIIGSQPLAGGLIIRSCQQMNNRGNGKGGGVAAAGLFPNELKQKYALHIAYLDAEVQQKVEQQYIKPFFEIAHQERQASCKDHREFGLEICPPQVSRYFVSVKPQILRQFMQQHKISSSESAQDEFVFQNSFKLNQHFYVESKPPAAFVLSHGKDLMILKAVGFAEQVALYYQLQECQAHVWIGHQRYPTRGRVWHPGGAHPFAGLHEALVHNGDFANYHAVTEYLRQYGIAPQFVTDTEVSVLLFDLYSRVFGYPLEFTIEALAPTPEGDFQRLSKRRQRIYRAIQSAHIHGSPDGPWFFIIARNNLLTQLPQLIGITDVSMLRPQVFAYQQSCDKSFGAIASEKQAIDAFFADLANSDPTVSAVADHYWNARGGSCTDGGAFCFSLVDQLGQKVVTVTDKFGDPIPQLTQLAPLANQKAVSISAAPAVLRKQSAISAGATDSERELSKNCAKSKEEEGPGDSGQGSQREERLLWGELVGSAALQQLAASLKGLLLGEVAGVEVEELLGKGLQLYGSLEILKVLTYLRDRRWDAGVKRRAEVLALLDKQIDSLLDRCPTLGDARIDQIYRVAWGTSASTIAAAVPRAERAVAIDASDFPPEGEQAVCRLVVHLYQAGWRRIIVYRCHGDRFLGCGLGSKSQGMRLDIYGSSGDYLGSGLDGAEIFVHGNAQDQVGQILKSGRIVVFGDVGQTLLYGAKGGEVFILGSAAGRPLINSVGKIRAIINGTCLDYCAESFMAGREIGDGFVIINGVAFDNRGSIIGLEQKYSGNNLFSLASGGACYLNDPYSTVENNQLNGGQFVPFRQADWNQILPYLRANETFFGISIRRDLLLVDGLTLWPKEVFRKIVPSRSTARLDWSSMPD